MKIFRGFRRIGNLFKYKGLIIFRWKADSVHYVTARRALSSSTLVLIEVPWWPRSNGARNFIRPSPTFIKTIDSNLQADRDDICTRSEHKCPPLLPFGYAFPRRWPVVLFPRTLFETDEPWSRRGGGGGGSQEVVPKYLNLHFLRFNAAYLNSKESLTNYLTNWIEIVLRSRAYLIS